MKTLYFSLVALILIGISCTEEPLLPSTPSNFCEDIHRNDDVTLSDQLKGLETKMKNKTGVYVLEQGTEAMLSRAWLSDHAQKTIDVQYFIFS